MVKMFKEEDTDLIPPKEQWKGISKEEDKKRKGGGVGENSKKLIMKDPHERTGGLMIKPGAHNSR